MPLPQTGALIAGKYRLEAPLGEGGMGAVFRARHELIDKAVALKWLKPSVLDDSRSEERFLQEARAAARIRHPNVVDVHDVGHHEGGLYMVMELLEGQDFGAMLDAGEVPFATALRHLIEAMRGVAAAHAAGIIHRDIKPENIFVAYNAHFTDGIAKILDFGISKLHDDSRIARTRPGVTMGTPHYMSIEQMNGEPDIDQRTDIYAFGVLLYLLLTGVMPFEGETTSAIMFARIGTQARSPAQLRPQVPAALDRAVMKAIALRREDRQATLTELIDAIVQSGAPTLELDWSTPAAGITATTRALGAERSSASRASAPGHTQQSVRPTRTRLILGLGVALLAAVIAAVLLQEDSSPPRVALPAELPSTSAAPLPQPEAPPHTDSEPQRPSAPEPRDESPLSQPAPARVRTRAAATASTPARARREAAVVPALPEAKQQEAPAATNASSESHRSGTLRKEDM